MTLGRAKLRGCLYRFRDANQEELHVLSPNRLPCFSELDFATKYETLDVTIASLL